jgi:hypothetical protein
MPNMARKRSDGKGARTRAATSEAVKPLGEEDKASSAVRLGIAALHRLM